MRGVASSHYRMGHQVPSGETLYSGIEVGQKVFADVSADVNLQV